MEACDQPCDASCTRGENVREESQVSNLAQRLATVGKLKAIEVGCDINEQRTAYHTGP
jgi:hypothetical protein